MSRLPPRPPLPSVSSSSPSNSSSQPPRAPFTLNAEALGDAGEMDVAIESTWLQPFQRTWEEVTEDESGLLVSTSLQQQKQRKAAIPVDPPLIISKGVIRALVLVIDFSAAMALTDLKPSRRLLTLSLLSTFITDYFDQNPLSQLSIVLGHRGVGVRVTELSGHPNEQLRVLRERCERLLVEEEKAQRQGSSAATAGGGSFSLQNCLTGDHRVLTSTGWKSINYVQEGDEVLSFNLTSYAQEWKPVRSVTSHAVEPTEKGDQLYRMHGSGMDVIATRNHRMLVALPSPSKRGLQPERPVDYETVDQLLSGEYAVSHSSKRSLCEHVVGRRVVSAGANLQPGVKLVLPGMQRVCEWWWRTDRQLGFFSFLGFWLGDGSLDVTNGCVQIAQKKDDPCEWVEALLDKVFTGWWRRSVLTTEDGDQYVYSIRPCPPLYKYFRLLAIGPVGYNPRDPAEVRRYPHFTFYTGLAEKEKASPYYVEDGTCGCVSRWTEEGMLRDFQFERCWWCGGVESVEGNELMLCDGDECDCGGHFLCSSLIAVPEGRWLCPDCAGDAETMDQEEGQIEQAAVEMDVDMEGDDEESRTDEAAPLQAVDAIVVWNGGPWHIDMDGHWFYLKRWMGPPRQIASIYSRLSRQQAIHLIDGFCRADGRWKGIQYTEDGEPTGSWQCSNSSFPLIDHLMLVAQLAGARVTLTHHTKAGKIKKIKGRSVRFNADHWQLLLNFSKTLSIPFQTAPLARPTDVSSSTAARGCYDYVDDGRVYCIRVEENTNFLTQRLCVHRLQSRKGRVGIRAHSIFVGNCLEMARSTLSGVPSYAAREMLCIIASLSTVDASDISTTMSTLKQHHITASVIHLAAELYVCTNLCQQTGGRHAVVMNKEHYQTLLRSHLPPTPSAAQSATSVTRRWMRMGFPQQLTTPYPLLCSCHTLLTYTAFQCPHCLSRYCELPTQCNVCSLQLVSSPQLARTYHHLFPSPVYRLREELSAVGEVCRGCGSGLVSGEDVACECSECGEVFCIDCDEFVHGVLHHCPGCNSAYKAKVEDGVEKVEDATTKKEVERVIHVKTEPIVLD